MTKLCDVGPMAPPANPGPSPNTVPRTVAARAPANINATYAPNPRPTMVTSPSAATAASASAMTVSALYPQPDRALAAAPATDLQTLEKQHILAVLDSVQGDKTRAAQLLGISRRTLERRCAEWALA